MKRIGSFFCFIVLAWSSWCVAEIPQTINFQGRLTNGSGAPLVDGTYSICISLYTQETEGNAVWNDLFNVPTKNGYFNLILGKDGTAKSLTDVLFDQPIYVGIKVGLDQEMTPRQLLNSVPYAFHAMDGVPKGAIIIWRGTTPPPGYRRVYEFDGLFLRGASEYGGQGGCESHAHTETTAGGHAHSFSGSVSGNFSGTTSRGDDSTREVAAGTNKTVSHYDHTHTYSGSIVNGACSGWTASNGDHTHGINSSSNLPPFINVIFCEKL